MFHTGKPEEADKEQNETMDCLKYVLDGNISLRVLRKNHLSHVCIVKGGFYAIHEYLYRSHRMDFSPEVSIVEATETGSRTRQGAALWSRHSLGLASKACILSLSCSYQAQKASKALTTLQQKTQAVLAKPETGLESVAELGEKGKNLLSKAFMWTRAKSATLMEEVAKKVNAVSEAEQIRTVPQQVDQSVFTVDE